MTHDGNRDCMGWLTTTNLDDFRAVAGGYLRSRGGEGTLLLRAARSLRGDQPLFGWWASPGGEEVRGAFLHDAPAPLLIVGRVPEFAAALAPALHQARRPSAGSTPPPRRPTRSRRRGRSGLGWPPGCTGTSRSTG